MVEVHGLFAAGAIRLYDLLPLLSHFSDCRDAVLMYHSVDNKSPLTKSYGNITPSRFERDLQHISSEYELTTLRSLVTSSDPTEKRIALTFDDGFRNFYTNVVPLLRKYDAPATVFVTPGLIGDPDQTKLAHELPTADHTVLMDEQHLLNLVDDPLVQIGNHTRTHPRLSELDADEQRLEILGAKKDLQELLGVSVREFCYPYGDFDCISPSIVEEGHDLAVSISPELVENNLNEFRVPRLHGHESPLRLRIQILR